MPIFTKKYFYFGPLEFVENEYFEARTTARAACGWAEILDLDF